MNNEKTIKWGILGLGKIAHKFAQDLEITDGCELYAVASRTLVKAEHFAKEFNVFHAYGDYKSLVEDINIDAIYIATPHSEHKKNSKLCLHHKKAVLCEKPLGMDLAEVHEMISIARNEKVLLMEALWTQFLPSFRFVIDKIKSGVLGDIVSLNADFGFRADYQPELRLFNKSLGGGSLLDIGIYPIFMALSCLGKPKTIKAIATFFETGADSSVDMEFMYNDNVAARLQCSLLEDTPTTARINLERGSIVLQGRFHEPTSVLIKTDKEELSYDFPTEAHGYTFEIEHFNQLLLDGKTESDLMSFEFSELISSTMDKVKEEIGLNY